MLDSQSAGIDGRLFNVGMGTRRRVGAYGVVHLGTLWQYGADNDVGWRGTGSPHLTFARRYVGRRHQVRGWLLRRPPSGAGL